MKDGLILGEEVAGVNQILPHKHQLAWDLFIKGVANNWSPAEINMGNDVDQWKNGDLTDDEKSKGDMENMTSLTGQTAPDFENVLVSDTTDPQDASLYGAFATPLASPINDHPDMPGGEDDIFQHGGTNTSPTTNLAYLDPKKVMAMAVSVSEGAIKQPLTPEEKLIVANTFFKA